MVEHEAHACLKIEMFTDYLVDACNEVRKLCTFSSYTPLSNQFLCRAVSLISYRWITKTLYLPNLTG